MQGCAVCQAFGACTLHPYATHNYVHQREGGLASETWHWSPAPSSAYSTYQNADSSGLNTDLSRRPSHASEKGHLPEQQQQWGPWKEEEDDSLAGSIDPKYSPASWITEYSHPSHSSQLPVKREGDGSFSDALSPLQSPSASKDVSSFEHHEPSPVRAAKAPRTKPSKPRRTSKSSSSSTPKTTVGTLMCRHPDCVNGPRGSRTFAREYERQRHEWEFHLPAQELRDADAYISCPLCGKAEVLRFRSDKLKPHLLRSHSELSEDEVAGVMEQVRLRKDGMLGSGHLRCRLDAAVRKYIPIDD